MLGLQESVKCCGRKVPHYFWFMLSGAICDVMQFLIDMMISMTYIWEWEKDTVCWTLSYVASIFLRHYSHRMLVFGEYDGTYWGSLGKMYLTYSSSIVISAVTNHILAKYFHLPHRAAWLVTMLWIGLYNYFMLKSVWRKPNAEQTAAAASGEIELENLLSKEKVDV